MGRPPGNGGPAFRFTPSEVSEMEAILQEHDNKLPHRDQFVTLAEKFSNGPERIGKINVQMKQVMNWFQNKRYALKAKSSKVTQKLDIAPLQAVPPLPPVQASVLLPIPHVRQEANGNPASILPRSFSPHSGKALNNVEFEARSARDGAWYDVAAFLSLKNKDTDDPEVLVRFVGLTSEEDEWIKVSKHVRHRSLPCEATECVAVLPGDLILCFQEAPEQALYFDAHVLDAQRWQHDSRGCRCRFMVRYDHDQSEETVPLRKICRRPETDYRLQIYQALRDLPTQQKSNVESTPFPVQVESVPMKEKVEAIHQKMIPFLGTPGPLEKTTTRAPEEGNAENITEESASKLTHKAEDILNQDVVTKKARIESENNDTACEPQTVSATPIVAQDQADNNASMTASIKEVVPIITTMVAEDPKPSTVTAIEGLPDPNTNSSPPSGAVVLTCMNQTNGHNTTNGGSSGSSDVPVGPPQQCF